MCSVLMLATYATYNNDNVVLLSFLVAVTMAVIFAYMSVIFSYIYLIILQL